MKDRLPLVIIAICDYEDLCLKHSVALELSQYPKERREEEGAVKRDRREEKLEFGQSRKVRGT